MNSPTLSGASGNNRDETSDPLLTIDGESFANHISTDGGIAAILELEGHRAQMVVDFIDKASVFGNTWMQIQQRSSGAGEQKTT
jgi:hypothetical protein